MSAQLVKKFKRSDPSRVKLTINRASQWATSISSSPLTDTNFHHLHSKSEKCRWTWLQRPVGQADALSAGVYLSARDGNGYPKPEYPTGFTRYEGGYGMISLPAGMLMGKNLYPLGRRVWVDTTHTRLPVGKIYPH
jgi:hypothetical protein